MKYMTNEISYLYDRFIDRMNDPDVINGKLHFNRPINYVLEYRTLALKLPRHVGKSYFIAAMAEITGSIVFVPNTSIRNEYYSKGVKSASITNERSLKSLTYENLFFDEVRVEQFFNMYPYIQDLITYDTTIVSLYTLCSVGRVV